VPAEQLVRSALADCREAASERAISWCQYYLGVNLLVQGRPAEALVELDGALAQFLADRSQAFLALAHSRRAVALARLARADAADAAADAAREVLAQCTDLPFELAFDLDRCTIDEARGQDRRDAVHRLSVAATGAGLADYDPIRVSAQLFTAGAPMAARLLASEGFREVTTPDGRVVQLARQAASRRLLIAMAQADRPLSVAELFAAGWPGEQIAHTSAVRRVYSAIHLLRSRGLDRWIEHDGNGYRLTARVERVPH
jgi:hypothetical protein